MQTRKQLVQVTLIEGIYMSPWGIDLSAITASRATEPGVLPKGHSDHNFMFGHSRDFRARARDIWDVLENFRAKYTIKAVIRETELRRVASHVHYSGKTKRRPL